MKVKMNVILDLDEGVVDAICDDMDKFGKSLIIINEHTCVVYNMIRNPSPTLDSDFPSAILMATEQEALY